MKRSLLAFAATAWFGFNALLYTAPGAFQPDGGGELAGDPAALAVTAAARMLCIGLVLLSLALVDWHWVGNGSVEMRSPPPEEA